MTILKKPEILAPAGDFEKLRYAIAYGADAVYLAGQHFGMRAAAGNFNDIALRQAIAYAHERHVKCYITVNIMPSSEDLKRLPAYLELLQDAGADALIVADTGVIAMAKRHAPRMPLHISTQTNILNYEAANFWADLGAERVVLARELRLSEIAEIRNKTPKKLELEAFVHGAMCISYSGRCLISQYMTERDANHGACAQPCRWKYSLMEEKRPGEYYPVEEDARGTYLYNSKDLCMIEHIPELIEAGINSFKIEGRAKTAYYAAGITGAYRRAVDAYQQNPQGFTLPKDILLEIGKVSHRNYYTGFYFDTEGCGQFYKDSHYIRDWEVSGLLIKCDADGNAVFRLKNRFFLGDVLELMQPDKAPYRFTAAEMWDDDGMPLSVAQHPEMHVHIKLPFTPHPFAILRKETQERN